MNDLKTEKEVLQWYIDMNSGGTPHSNMEIERVKENDREFKLRTGGKGMEGYNYTEVQERKFKMIYKYRDWFIKEVEKMADTPEGKEVDKAAEEYQKKDREKREREEKEWLENRGKYPIYAENYSSPKTHAQAIERIKKIYEKDKYDMARSLPWNATQDEVNKVCSLEISMDMYSWGFPPKVKEFADQERKKRYYIMLSPIEKEGYKKAQEFEKLKKDPYEKVGYAELNRRYHAKHEPQTSLSEEQIAHFDRMSTSSLAGWCKFSMNWYWVAPCMFLCLFVNKGLIAFIGLLAFMIGGSIYAGMVQEYCSVILPWYEASGKTIEKRYLKK